MLQLRSGGRDFIARASRSSHHIEREIAAHENLFKRMSGRVPRLVNCSIDERILLTDYLPGMPVEGTPAELDPDVYLQAGALLAGLLMPGEQSADYVSARVAAVRMNLSNASALVSGSVLRELEVRVGAVVDAPVPMSFTHGDYQPRNWIVHDGELRVIDFGRAALRHWTSDLVRLNNQQFVGHPELKRAFVKGLDRSMTDLDHRMLQLSTLQQAVGTAVWAHEIGDSAFEEHGRFMINRLLADDG